MTSRMLIAGLAAEEETCRKIGKLAAFAGASAAECEWLPVETRCPAILEALRGGARSLVCSVDALRELDARFPELLHANNSGKSFCETVIVFGCGEFAKKDDFLSRLSVRRVTGATVFNGTSAECSISASSRDICGPMAGTRVALENGASFCTFAVDAGAGDTGSIMAFGDAPFLLGIGSGRGRIFLLGMDKVPDIEEQVAEDGLLLARHFPLVPWLAVLRQLLGDRAWSNPRQSACLVIDDPLLQNRYGFLDYQALLDVMRHDKFCASIAFIPCNYRRSSRHVAGMFSGASSRYSICVHGCDHTAGEFGADDESLLQAKARCALERMGLHERLSGVSFDDVMVFPQGIFSEAAMRALGAEEYLAAVNSSPVPVHGLSPPFTLRELISPAVTRFSRCPLFVRRYPKNPVESAFDLFLGKPALMVEHHGYFKGGYEALATHVKALNAMVPALEWERLGTICARACLQRRADKDTVHVRFYSDRFELQNAASVTQNIVLYRHHAADEPLPVVHVNGREVKAEQEGGFLTMILPLEAKEKAAIALKRKTARPAPMAFRVRPLERAKILMRRRLSEFRDNHVQTNRLLSRMASGVKRLLK